MMVYLWGNVIKEIKKSHSIPAKTLSHIPKLRDCGDWGRAEFIGRVIHSFPLSKLDGGLVEFAGGLYYINISQLRIIAKTYKWNLDRVIKVIEDKGEED